MLIVLCFLRNMLLEVHANVSFQAGSTLCLGRRLMDSIISTTSSAVSEMVAYLTLWVSLHYAQDMA